MNRFEALHTLGLEENASDDDVRLSYYGIEKAVNAFDFSGFENVDHMAKNMLEHAKESRTFLLASRNKSAARRVQSYSAKSRGKVSVTPVVEKTARLRGLERLRAMLVFYLDEERTRRRACIIELAICIVVSFIALRYLRAVPRIIAFAVILVFALAGSTIFTTAHLHVRKTRAYVLEIDDAIASLRRDLGLDSQDEQASGEAALPCGGEDRPAGVDTGDEDLDDCDSPEAEWASEGKQR